jgi:hypothetical protein
VGLGLPVGVFVGAGVADALALTVGVLVGRGDGDAVAVGGAGVLLDAGAGPELALTKSSGGLLPSPLLNISRLPSLLEIARLYSPGPVM